MKYAPGKNPENLTENQKTKLIVPAKSDAGLYEAILSTMKHGLSNARIEATDNKIKLSTRMWHTDSETWTT